jgi:hypothetical protein
MYVFPEFKSSRRHRNCSSGTCTKIVGKGIDFTVKCRKPSPEKYKGVHLK